MRRRLIIIYVLLVMGPLLLLAGLGTMWARLEQERLRNQFRELLVGNLREVDGTISRLIQSRRRQFIELTRQAPVDLRELENLTDKNPWVRQAFLIASDGRLIYPSRQTQSPVEMDFIERTREIWWRKDLPPYSSNNQSASNQAAISNNIYSNSGIPSSNPPSWFGASGWYGWYLGSGLNLVYWSRLDDGRCLCVEIDRMRMLADIIAQLPDTAPRGDRLPNGRIALRDSNNVLLYQWGAYEYHDQEKPLTSLALTAPLQSWRLDYHAPASLYAAAGGTLMFSYAAGFGAIALALIGLAFYFYRESTREMRLAGERVSFVNQVSHELKTPLTNVRLYAELLQQHLDGEDETAQRHLGIVVEECGRLSRLIGNVLTFGRSQRGTLTIRPAPGRVDDIIQRVLDGYRPTLERRGIEVRYSAGPAETVMVASDVVEQILVNLLSNIEKYAADGGVAEICSAQQDGTTTIIVADRGPGIPAAEREKIFKPFYRMSSALNDGAAGTGIGLAIARELARGHGGDLRVVDCENGTTFEVKLKTPAGE